jgi:putative transcriptional regulator
MAFLLVYLSLLLACAVANGSFAAIAPPAREPKPAAATPAAGMFLVARRGFLDPNFNQTVVYLLQHDGEATFGLVVNRPGDSPLSSVLPYVADTPFAASPVYRGGPMDPDLLVMLIRNAPGSSLMRQVIDTIQASVSLQVLDELLVDHKPPDEVRFYRGYAGWSPGRLEKELEHHYWHLTKGDPAAVFGPDAAALWQTLIDRFEPPDSPPGSGNRTHPGVIPQEPVGKVLSAPSSSWLRSGCSGRRSPAAPAGRQTACR